MNISFSRSTPLWSKGYDRNLLNFRFGFDSRQRHVRIKMVGLPIPADLRKQLDETAANMRTMVSLMEEMAESLSTVVLLLEEIKGQQGFDSSG